jgi:hypothetical protein
MQLRDGTLGERHEGDSEETQTLKQAGGVLLVTAESIQRLRDEYVESMLHCVLHQLLDAWAQQQCCAGERVIGILLADRPTLALDEQPTEAKLIGDGRIALHVAGVAGVESSLHRGHSFLLGVDASGTFARSRSNASRAA